MTALLERDQTEASPGAGVTPGAAAGPSSAKQRSQLALIVLVAIVAAGLLVLVDGLLSHVWYTNRQHHLAADLTAQHPKLLPGEALGVIQIPRLGVNAMVIEGDNPDALRSGPGHRVATPRPGAVGNSVISGHHTRWGAPFAKVGTLQKGDLILVQPRDSAAVVFQVATVQRVHGGDARLLQNTRDHRLTLVTAAGGLFSDDRVVVQAITGGTVKGRRRGAAVPARPPDSSPWQNPHGLYLVLLVGLGTVVASMVWRRYGRITAVVVVLPFALLALLQFFLAIDSVLPPFR